MLGGGPLGSAGKGHLFDFFERKSAVLVGVPQGEQFLKLLFKLGVFDLGPADLAVAVAIETGEQPLRMLEEPATLFALPFPLALASAGPVVVGRDAVGGGLGFSVPLNGDAGEERGQLVELLPFPLVVRMVVTIRALDLDAQENPRRLGGDLVGLAPLSENEGRLAMLGDFARGGQQAGGDLVPAAVLTNLVGHPVLEDPHHHLGLLVGRPQKDHVAPVGGPVCAYSSLASRLSIIFVRLSESGLRPNIVTSRGKGTVPARSKWTRRRKSSSDVRGRLGAGLGQVVEDHPVDRRRHGRRVFQIDERPRALGRGFCGVFFGGVLFCGAVFGGRFIVGLPLL